MKNIILIGPPGAGKGTQAKLLSKKQELIHISTGDLIREEQAKDTKIGKLATQLADHGNFLPDQMVTSIVKQKIIDNHDAKGFIFDGFPRTVEQAKALDEFLIHRKTPVSEIIVLQVSDEVTKNRILEKAKIENRSDDKEEVVLTRIHNYKTKTKLVLDYYQNSFLLANNRNMIFIDGNKNIEEVTLEFEAVI